MSSGGFWRAPRRERHAERADHEEVVVAERLLVERKEREECHRDGRTEPRRCPRQTPERQSACDGHRDERQYRGRMLVPPPDPPGKVTQRVFTKRLIQLQHHDALPE